MPFSMFLKHVVRVGPFFSGAGVLVEIMVSDSGLQ